MKEEVGSRLEHLFAPLQRSQFAPQNSNQLLTSWQVHHGEGGLLYLQAQLTARRHIPSLAFLPAPPLQACARTRLSSP